MTGAEVAVGYLCAWLVGKARRVAKRADTEIDRGVDAGMDRLHELVSSKLGSHPTLEQVRAEAEGEGEEPSPSARQLLADELEKAAEDDSSFAGALKELIAEIQGAKPSGAGETTITMSGTFHGQTVGQGTIYVMSAGLPGKPDPASQPKPRS